MCRISMLFAAAIIVAAANNPIVAQGYPQATNYVRIHYDITSPFSDSSFVVANYDGTLASEGEDPHDQPWVPGFNPSGVGAKLIGLKDGIEYTSDIRPIDSTTPLALVYDIVTDGRSVPSHVTGGTLTWEVHGFNDWIITVNGTTAREGSFPTNQRSGTFEVTFIAPPEVGTMSPEDVTSTSATLKGKLDNDGNNDCEVRFKWWTDNDSGYTDWQCCYNTNDTFSETLSDLDPSVTYHYQAEARNSASSDQGGTKRFNQNHMPTVETLQAEVKGTMATLKGSLLDDGSYDTKVGFAYWQTGSIHDSNEVWNSGSYHTGDSFTYILRGLDPHTDYSFSALAENSAGADVGDSVGFTIGLASFEGVLTAWYEIQKIGTNTINTSNTFVLSHFGDVEGSDGLDVNDELYSDNYNWWNEKAKLVSVVNDVNDPNVVYELSSDSRLEESNGIVNILLGVINRGPPGWKRYRHTNKLFISVDPNDTFGRTIYIQQAYPENNQLGYSPVKLENITDPNTGVAHIEYPIDDELRYDNLFHPIAMVDVIFNPNDIVDFDWNGMVDANDFAMLNAHVGLEGSSRYDFMGDNMEFGHGNGIVDVNEVICFENMFLNPQDPNTAPAN